MRVASVGAGAAALAFLSLLLGAAWAEPGGTMLLALDGDGTRRVEAGVQAAEAGAWADALALWLPLLERTCEPGSDLLVPAGEGRYIPAADLVRELLAGLPEEGAAAYRGRAAPRAEGAWRLAVRDRDEGALARILERYPWTETASRAARLLAERATEAGDAAGEARWLEAWIRTERSLGREAEPEVVLRLRAAAERAIDEAAWVRSFSLKGEAVPLDREGPMRTAPGLSGPGDWARLDVLPLPTWMQDHPVAPQQERALAYTWVEQNGTLVLMQQVVPGTHRGSRPVPSCAAGRVIAHDGQTLVARAESTGASAWQAMAPARYGVPQGPQVSQEVVLARGLAFVPLPAEEGEHNPHGGYFFKLPRQDLYALDAERGRVRWQLTRVNPRLAELSFCSPPRCALGDVYVSGTAFSGLFGCELVCASIEDGTARWRRFLASGQQEMSYFGRPVREAVPSPAAVRGEIVVVSTNLGVVAGVDPRTGAWRWAHVYPQVPLTNQGTQSENIAPRLSGWLNREPVFCGDVIAVAPTDCDWLLGIDTRDGTLRWRVPIRQDGLLRALAGAVDGRVLVSGDAGAYAFEGATGKRLWARRCPGGDLPYLGSLDGGLWLLPARNVLRILDARTGGIARSVEWGAVGPGTVAMGAHGLLIATADRLSCVPVVGRSVSATGD